ncbi:50S ribosomal protein L9 [Limisphaera ngatamarikiensis]|uniref:Large ribosomal subunit protein bL9 n=1 Tax=Limisphaera ngatamarikiensis TaxID=1324935 RepID=A0A6M1RRR4_9BACT|nr:50S ribosomal protein L9 [Limisphaera ngatamarikiensis]NGO40219.1 50S ribosomal protein L9 [Limisphaera ngatamarikiensis]
MAKMQVILTSNIVGLGAESDQVTVAAGYARNYLFPRGLAIPLTAANKRRLEVLRQRRAEREAQEYNTMCELARSLAKLICVITVKTGDDGKLFGSVTSGTIADALKTQFDISLDKKQIHLEQPIKSLGEYEVELRLHPEVKGVLKVRVESSNPTFLATQAAATATAAEAATQTAETTAEAQEPKTTRASGKKEAAAKKAQKTS